MKKSNLFRLLTLAMALVMLVAVVACTNEGEATPTTAGQTVAATTPGATTVKATTAKATTAAATTAKATTAATTKATTAATTAATTVATTAATTAAPSAPSVYSGTPDTSWFDKDNPKAEYTLTTADQFVGIQQIRKESEGVVTFKGITIKLAADVIINAGTPAEYRAGTPLSVTALNSNYKFEGVFDGQNHTVNGIFIDCTSNGVRGLFGGLGDNAVIKNLKITNSYFNAAEANKNTAGILAARANGTNILISNVIVENVLMEESANENTFYGVGILVGKVDADMSLTIENCSTSGTVDFTNKGTKAIAGMVGFTSKGSTLTIKNCTSSATIKGLDYCGGFLGLQNDESTVNIEGCTFTGTIVCPGEHKGNLIGDGDA